jgi:hypothetical protein
MDEAEKRRAAIAESRALLERSRNPEPKPAPEPEVELPPIETFRDRQRRWADEADAERERGQRELRREEQRHRAADIDAKIKAAIATMDAKIDAAIGRYHEQVIEIVGAALHQARAPIVTSFAEIESKLAKLGATLAELRAHEDRRPLDMPSPLSPRGRTVN